MAQITSLIVLVVAINALILLIVAALWYQFKEMQKSYWQNRHMNSFESSKASLFSSFAAAKKNSIRIKPKVKSDAQLFDLEQKNREL